MSENQRLGAIFLSCCFFLSAAAGLVLRTLLFLCGD